MIKLFSSLLLFASIAVQAQDINELLDEARKLEQRYKEPEAFEKYKQVLVLQNSNMKALLKCAELNFSIGGREKEPDARRPFYSMGRSYSEQAYKYYPDDAEVNYMMGVSELKLLQLETKNPKAQGEYIKNAKAFADRAVSLNPDFGKGFYLVGKWYYEWETMSGARRTAINAVVPGLPLPNIDKAISNMEKCVELEPYFCQNFLDLAKSYNYDKQYEKAIAVLEKLAKLPTRRQDDIGIKAEGAELLRKLQ
jgi:tetratricopeptide (TPR) repeat protein